MISFGVDAQGGLDVLVNNADIAIPTAPVDEMNPDEWDKVVQVTRTVVLPQSFRKNCTFNQI